nr:MAG TPA: DNA (cytosine-5)-methyltransferase 3A [Caudoviricetes sp.]
MATEKTSINVLGINDEIGSILMALKQLDVNVGTFYTIGVNNTCLDVIKGNFPSTNVIKVTEDTKDFKADLIMAKNIFGGSSQSNEDDDEEGSNESQLALLKHYIDLFSEGDNEVLWLLEERVLSNADEELVTRTLGTTPCKINASLVSAQNKERLYWSNLGEEEIDLFGEKESNIPMPQDKCVSLGKLVRDNEVDEWSDDEDEEDEDKEKFTFVSLDGVTLPDLSSVDTAYYVSGAIRIRGEAKERVLELRKDSKSNAITASKVKCLVVSVDGRGKGDTRIECRHLTIGEVKKLYTIPSEYDFSRLNTSAWGVLSRSSVVDILVHILSSSKAFATLRETAKATPIVQNFNVKDWNELAKRIYESAVNRGFSEDAMEASNAGMLIVSNLTRAYSYDEFGVENVSIGGKESISKVIELVNSGLTADKIICPNGSAYDHTTNFFFGEVFCLALSVMMNDKEFEGFDELYNVSDDFSYFEDKYRLDTKKVSAIWSIIEEYLFRIECFFRYPCILGYMIRLADMFGVDAYESTILRLTYNELQGYTHR